MERRSTFAIALAAVVLLAAALRVAPLRAGLPYSDYIDEGYALSQAIDHLNTRSLHCRWYGYPTLTSYLTAAVIELARPVYRSVHGRELLDDLPKDSERYLPLGLDYNRISPEAVILAGRAVVLLASIGTVVLAWRLGSMIGGPAIGAAAMLLTAVCPALVLRSANVIVDSTATFFVLAALYFAERVRRSVAADEALWRDVALAGAAAGLALGSKYTAGAVFVAVLMSIAFAPTAALQKTRWVAVASGSAAMAALVANPAFVLRPETIEFDMRQTGMLYRQLRGLPSYWEAAISMKELGIPLVAAGSGGLLLMLANRSTRATAAAWIAFAFALLIPLLPLSFQPFRNLLPLVPPFCVSAAVFFTLPRHRQHWTPPAALRYALLVGLLITTALCVVTSGREIAQRIAHTDTRVVAVNWIRTNTEPTASILAVAELSVLPSEWERTGRRIVVVPWLEAIDALERGGVDYVVGAEMNIQHLVEPEWAPHLAAWNARVSALPVAASFGQVPNPVYPYLWRTNDQRLIIWRMKADDAAAQPQR